MTKRSKEDLPVELQGSEWSPLSNLALDLTKVLGLKVLTALKLNSTQSINNLTKDSIEYTISTTVTHLQPYLTYKSNILKNLREQPSQYICYSIATHTQRPKGLCTRYRYHLL